MAGAARLAEAERDALTAARGTAARLLEEAFQAAVPIGAAPHSAHGWLTTLISRLPSRLWWQPAGSALLVGSALAVLDSVAALSGKASRTLELGRLVDLATGARSTGSPHGWLGYIPVSGGWLSVALGPAEIDDWRRFLAGVVPDAPATELAECAQQWGLACLPASAPTESALTTTAASRLPPLADVGEALGLSPLRALTGLRVLDLGMLVAAPLTCAVLEACGAEVTPVVHPARKNARWYGGSAVELDLNRAADRAGFTRLCRTADVVVDNFTARVWENFGFEPLELGARLHLSMPAFPSEGPRRNYRAFGFQTEAFFGVGCAPDPTATGPLVAPRAALMDHTVGLAGAVNCLGAIASGRTGRMELSHAGLARLAPA
jgi:hypothetical protein